MRLLLPSLVIAFYIFFSLILPLRRVQLWVKALLSVALLTVSMKYLFYETVGGSFFRPDLPVPVLIMAEALYASLVVLFFLAILKDLAGLGLWLCRLGGLNVHHIFQPGVRASLLTILALGLGIWGSLQAVRVPGSRTVEVAVPGLPAELDGFSIVQLTDIHIGPIFKSTWLTHVVEKANALDADAIVITGDFIDGLPAELAHEMSPLASLRARHGVFGINGNHEYYYDAPGWLPVFRSLGVDILNNEHRVLPGGLVLGGVTDRTAQRFGLPGPDVEAAFANAPAGPRILLSHQPVFRESIPVKSVSLQLSGHTHGGLLFFLSPLIAHFNGGYVNGLYRFGNGWIYVAPGTGLWSGFSCRLGVPSEITRLVLKRG